MNYPKRKAMELRQKLGFVGILHSSDIDRALDYLDVEVKYWHLPLPMLELFIGRRLIILSSFIPHEWRPWIKAHAVGHQRMHRGDQLKLMETNSLLVDKQERQANVFAGWFYLGHPPRGSTCDQLAYAANLPWRCIRRWAYLTGATPNGRNGPIFWEQAM